MVDRWFIDYESYYSREYSLRRMTVPEYILDSRFECMGAAVKRQGECARWVDGPDLPAFFESLDPNNTMLISHNALFDACITAWVYGFHPKLTGDTLGIARAMLGHELKSLSLASVAVHLGVGVKGDTIHKVEGMSSAAIKAAGLWDSYTAYALNDADQCANIWEELVVNRKFPAKELVLMDRIIRCATQPKFQLDQHVLALHLAEVKAKKEALMARIGFSKEDLMSNDKFAAALRSLGVDPPQKTSLTTGKETWAFSKTDPQFIALDEHENPEVQALVAARLGVKTTLEEKRTERFIALSNLQWSEGDKWMPIPLRYGGAHTHRLSGEWKLNLQNLPRGGNLRRALVAPPGYKVIAPDSSQIEARINAWVGGEQELLQAFREKRDVYSEFASIVFGRSVNKGMKKERFVGKTCLAENTTVLTNRGWLPIQYVTTQHLLWDGIEWVTHQGLLPQGIKLTTQYRGLAATEDHEILTEHGWVAWQGVHTNHSLFQSALNSANLPSSDTNSTIKLQGDLQGGNLLLNALVAGKGMLTGAIFELGAQLNVIDARKSRHRPNGFGVTKSRLMMTITAPDYSIAYLQRLDGAIRLLIEDIVTTVREGYEFMKSGAKIALPFFDMFKPCMVGITQSLRWIASTLVATTNRETSASSVDPTTSKINDKLSTYSNGSRSSKRRLQTYDLANAGPRHRFTVLTDDGPVIVSNCILGLGYGMGWMKFQSTIKMQSRAQLGEIYDMSVDEAQKTVRTYRQTYAGIAALWGDIQANGLPVLVKGNGEYSVGPCVFTKNKISLPSGLHLHYHDMAYDGGSNEYLYTYGGMKKVTHGSKVVENIVQALARIVVMDAALAIDKRFAKEFGRDIGLALQVHDELVYIVPDELVDRAVVISEEEMSRPPVWALDLPLASECDIGSNYGEAK